MKNLVGLSTRHADAYIEDELTEANIPIVPISGSPPEYEVKYSIYGLYNSNKHSSSFLSSSFVFKRAWYYWIAEGPVPLPIAEEIYKEMPGDVRAGGDAGCRAPETWTKGDFVDVYHIDTQDGLNYFAEKIGARQPLTEARKEEAARIASENRYGQVINDRLFGEEEKYREAAERVHAIRGALGKARHDLFELANDLDEKNGSLRDAEGALTTLISSLYRLEDPDGEMGYIGIAEARKRQVKEFYRNPEKFVLNA